MSENPVPSTQRPAGASRPTNPPESGAASELDLAVETSLPLALTTQEVAQVLRLDPRTVRAMLRAGELGGNRRGHALRISRSSVLDWLSGKRRVPRSKR